MINDLRLVINEIILNSLIFNPTSATEGSK